MPHELNGLCKSNRKAMYNIIMRASWQCIKQLCEKQENVGALPGMISVLHTFGSDKIDKKIKNNGDSIVALFGLLKALLKRAPYRCEKCQSCDYDIKEIKIDVNWIFYFITLPHLRGPPEAKAHKNKRA